MGLAFFPGARARSRARNRNANTPRRRRGVFDRLKRVADIGPEVHVLEGDGLGGGVGGGDGLVQGVA